MELDRHPGCFCEAGGQSLPLHATDPSGLAGLLAGLKRAQAAYLAACGFAGKAGEVALLPADAGTPGLGGAVLGLGEARKPHVWPHVGPHVWGALPGALPAGTTWRLPPGLPDPCHALLGWGLGAYRFDRLRREAAPAPPLLELPSGQAAAETVAAVRATWLARDLINMPANLLGPAELARQADAALRRRGARTDVIAGDALRDRFPVIDAVGRGSRAAPCVLHARWQHPDAPPDAPLVWLCGKGVCFDTGGYDMKPAAGMLRMKKDMGGAAIALGLACLVIDAGLKVRLELRLGCAENMVSGDAMRPLDILRTRAGVTIEVGNTDAEGRLVLCELLAEAAGHRPDVLLDFATLTGAARVALGPDLPALFCNDDALAAAIVCEAAATHDPVWRLPLWKGYESWIDSSAADMNNVSDRPHAGAIVAALFLQRFVPAGTAWAHFDVYAWNDTAQPGRPAGGEAHAMRAALASLKRIVSSRSVQQ